VTVGQRVPPYFSAETKYRRGSCMPWLVSAPQDVAATHTAALVHVALPIGLPASRQAGDCMP
jgi:hypothetical protein